mmetsp:Transcript_104053/g.320974  ORF Transcript_104053/g.320974 Transcript_104053/m.320974 type:complete len:280 (-) Transcript_104053:713-1552(-)
MTQRKKIRGRWGLCLTTPVKLGEFDESDARVRRAAWVPPRERAWHAHAQLVGSAKKPGSGAAASPQVWCRAPSGRGRFAVEIGLWRLPHAASLPAAQFASRDRTPSRKLSCSSPSMPSSASSNPARRASSPIAVRAAGRESPNTAARRSAWSASPPRHSSETRASACRARPALPGAGPPARLRECAAASSAASCACRKAGALSVLASILLPVVGSGWWATWMASGSCQWGTPARSRCPRRSSARRCAPVLARVHATTASPAPEGCHTPTTEASPTQACE